MQSVSGTDEDRAGVLLLICEPCTRVVRALLQTGRESTLAAKDVEVLTHQFRMLGALLRLVAHGPAPRLVFQVLFAPSFQLISTGQAPSKAVSAIAGFVNDVIRSEHHEAHFAQEYLQQCVVAVRTAVAKQPQPALLELCKYLVTEFGEGREKSFAALLESVTLTVLPPLVAALRNREATVAFRDSSTKVSLTTIVFVAAWCQI